VVSSTPRPHFTPGKDPVPILQDTVLCTGSLFSDSYRLFVISVFRREADENCVLLGQRVAQFCNCRLSVTSCRYCAWRVGGRMCGLRQYVQTSLRQVATDSCL